MSLKKIALIASFMCCALNVNAAPIIVGGKLFAAETGNVSVKFLGSDAGYTNILFFDPLGLNIALFNGHATPVGTTIDLGNFLAGKELQFKLHVNNTNQDFFTGPASSNPDNFNHASATIDANKVAIVGFEDLYGGGDQDFNDLMFSVSNVSSVSVPNIAQVSEPATLGMLAGGLGLIGFMANRRKKAV